MTDLLNASGLDDCFSNFRAFDIGKPSEKQIVKWEKTNPKKIKDLIAKKVITQADVDVANQKENYIPVVAPLVTSTSNDSSSSDISPKEILMKTFTALNLTKKADLIKFKGILKSVKDKSDDGLTDSEIADFAKSEFNFPVDAKGIAGLKMISDDTDAMAYLDKKIADAPIDKPSVTTSTSTTTASHSVKKVKYLKATKAALFVVGVSLIALGIYQIVKSKQ